jgi:hypothetical protein
MRDLTTWERIAEMVGSGLFVGALIGACWLLLVIGGAS